MSGPTPTNGLRSHLRARRETLASRADAGFALTEVLVSMIILMIVGSATALAIISGTNSSTVTSIRVAATNLAQQSLQQAMDLPRGQLAPTTLTTAVGKAQYTVARTLTYSVAGASSCPTVAPAGVPNTVTVHVVVTGGSGTVQRSVTMDTVLAC